MSGQIVRIEATPGSGTLISEATQFNKKLNPDGTPTDEDVNVGKYAGERFPKSRQIFRPAWSKSKRRFLIGDTTKKQLSDVVSELDLCYEKGIKFGEPITSANPGRLSDPFFNHSKLSASFKEGFLELDMDNIEDAFMLECMRSSEKFRTPDEKNAMKIAKGVFVIIDEKVSKKASNEAMSKEIEAISRFNNMDFDKKRQIAYAMRVGIQNNTDPEDVSRLLYDTIKRKGILFGGKTAVDLFLELSEGSSADLNLKYLIARAIKKGVIRESGSQYHMYGKDIGRTLQNVESYLLDEENSMQFDMLRADIDDE